MLFIIQLLLAQVVLGWSPTNGYAPGPIASPGNDTNLLRNSHGLSKREAEWVTERNKVTDQNLIDFLKLANMTDFDPEDFVNNKANRSIKIGVAFSGGGYRAMLSGAGQLSALDSRVHGANENGLGGLLQASTYLCGLSGGNWLVGTIAMNNFTSVDEILRYNKIWDLEHSIINYGGINLAKTFSYYKDIDDTLDAKRDAGYDVSFTDVWARALSHQFFANLLDYGAGLTWSTLQEMDPFTQHQMPFPIVVSDGRTPGTLVVDSNSTVFEFNAFEMGSWDPSLHQFTQVKYLGTNTTGGKPNNGTYIGGMDNAGFVMGTSSSLFNQFLLQINTTSLPLYITDVVTSILQKVSKEENDIAVYEPNPFHDTLIGTVKSIERNETLFLADGGEDGQNVPFYPLIQPERQVDVIFAYDNSADTEFSWPNGTSAIATFHRQFGPQSNGTIFPYVPDARSFRNLNLTARPTFFGCDAKNLSSLLHLNSSDHMSVYDSPLVVYTANRPFSFWSNTSTFKLKYENDEKIGMIRNGFEAASRLNRTLDSEWAACVGCAIIRREQERHGIDQSDQCKQCFLKYCWDGSLDSTDEPGVNFTETGTTNGQEGKHSGASRLSGWLETAGYAAIMVVVFAMW